MCGRYCLFDSPDEVGSRFGADVRHRWAPRYNIAPSQRVAVVRRRASRDDAVGNDLDGLQWGLVPHWVRDPDSGRRPINARAETANEKPSFRSAWVSRRCLVPARGFYEWRKTADGRQPCYMSRADGDLLALGGLWERWSGPDGTSIDSVAILTTAANRMMAGIHDRMPVILEPSDWSTWLDDGAAGTDLGTIARLARPAPDHTLEARLVSRLVNSPANDEPGCIEPVTAA